MQKDDVGEITRRLDVIIGQIVKCLPGPENRRSLREQIQLLAGAGLGPADIGRVVGRPAKSISSELSKMKGRTGKE